MDLVLVQDQVPERNHTTEEVTVAEVTADTVAVEEAVAVAEVPTTPVLRAEVRQGDTEAVDIPADQAVDTAVTMYCQEPLSLFRRIRERIVFTTL